MSVRTRRAARRMGAQVTRAMTRIRITRLIGKGVQSWAVPSRPPPWRTITNMIYIYVYYI